MVYLSYGNKVVFEDTIFEQCSATNSIIYLEGITNPIFSRVWIEACNAPSFIKTSLFEGQDCYVLSLISSHFNLSGTGFSPSIACVDFDNTSNKNIRVIDCLISGGTAPLVSAGVTYIEKSGNFSTTAGHSLLPNAPAFFGSGISSPNAAVSTLVASAHCASPLFYSFVVTLSATASPAPIYTFPTVSKTSMYLVSAASYRNDATNYSAFAVVATDLNTGRLVLNNGSVGVVLTISGLVLSAASNGDVEISMSILQIA